MKKITFILSLLLLSVSAFSQEYPDGGATERTPSHSEYFTWINNTNEGSDEQQTRINLEFFRYLREKYGMVLDIYAFDAGNIDGSKRYGTMKSDDFKRHFPNGFGPLSDFAAQDGTRLGIWCGPDGFGDTEAEAQERCDMMTSLVSDHNFGLFKMDGVCGQLRQEKYDWFVKMMAEIRRLSPDFVLLNHRLDLGPGTKYSTTYLLGGAETYIDVHMANDITAPHHRVTALAREVPPTHLTEDHGVCLSSCLDYWDDDLILQAFNRNLILAPEIYGNPWLLKDEEFPKLAFIYNLHRDYRDILVDSVRLPEDKYGLNAVSRGDGKTMFLTLRNLSWSPVTYHLSLDEEVGLSHGGKVQVRMYHPYVFDMGSHDFGSVVDVEVLPFRSCLVKVTTVPEKDNLTVSGIPYEIINDRVGDTYEVKLLGEPGLTYTYSIRTAGKTKKSSISFPGAKLALSPFRHIATMQRCGVPEDISSVYYATVFAADNNALEVRCLERSGETSIPQVKAARDAFFNQKVFIERGIWDRNLFDDDLNTFFNISFRWGEMRVDDASQFLLDFGEQVELDKLVITTDTEYSLSPLKYNEGTYVFVSADLKEWKQLMFVTDVVSELDMSMAGKVRYLRFGSCPIRLAEVAGYKNGMAVDRSRWRASNLFDAYGGDVGKASRTWKSEFVLDEIPSNSYLCVAVNGNHGDQGAWAGFKIDGEYVGCPDRATSYRSNTWECPVRNKDHNYTYYLPLTQDMKGKKIEAFVMQMDHMDNGSYIYPEIWMGVYPLPFEQKSIEIKK